MSQITGNEGTELHCVRGISQSNVPLDTKQTKSVYRDGFLTAEGVC